jgi:formylglycine-generating enzyme required for sulfatase activity
MKHELQKSTSQELAAEISFSRAQINSFEREHRENTLQLAKYAAFAQCLTPDFLYCLRENADQFRDGKLMAVPWYGPADILLSSLCQRIGSGLYEMSAPLRMELLQDLRKERGDRFIQEDLSDFMASYIYSNLEGSAKRLQAEQIVGEPKWTVLACFGKGHELAEKIRTDLRQRRDRPLAGDEFYWSAVTENYGVMLPGEPLLMKLAEEVAEGTLIGAGVDNNQSAWAAEYGIALEWQSVKVGKIRVDGLESRNPDVLQTFEFEVAKVDRFGNELLPRQQGQGQFFIELLGDQDNLKTPYLEMVAIPGGTFMMGSTEYEDEQPVHQVTVPPFYMSKYPVTQAQWRAVAAMKDLRISQDLKLAPSGFSGDDNLPVEQVSWLEAREFCGRVTKFAQREFKIKSELWECRLPTEAEWEYACRSPKPTQNNSEQPEGNTAFHFGDTISTTLANYDGNRTYGEGQKGEYRERTTPVGSFGVANNFGLYDMHGNVWEWCEDDWHNNYNEAPSDGSAWLNPKRKKSDEKILRGGSWNFDPNVCRSANRYGDITDFQYNVIGFRVVYAPARTP